MIILGEKDYLVSKPNILPVSLFTTVNSSCPNDFYVIRENWYNPDKLHGGICLYVLNRIFLLWHLSDMAKPLRCVSFCHLQRETTFVTPWLLLWNKKPFQDTVYSIRKKSASKKKRETILSRRKPPTDMRGKNCCGKVAFPERGAICLKNDACIPLYRRD